MRTALIHCVSIPFKFSAIDGLREDVREVADADDALFAALEQADAARPGARAAMRAAGEAAEAANAAVDAAHKVCGSV